MREVHIQVVEATNDEYRIIDGKRFKLVGTFSSEGGLTSRDVVKAKAATLPAPKLVADQDAEPAPQPFKP